MSAESPRHARSGGPLTVPSQPPPDRSIIDAVSGFINDVKLTSSSTVDPKDVIQWARFETADINEPTPEGDADTDEPPLLLILGYGAGVQVWLIPPSGEAQEVLSWRQGTVRVLRILPTPVKGDCFAPKRPLIALCDSASPGPAFCSLSFISIRGGEQVKSIKFKNPILDVLANKRSVVVSFSERFAVFDAGTLEDRMAVTTCYPCPCPLGGTAPINPLALGDRWLAYADKKLNQSKRSSGGCEGEGVSSYTATVLHAAKSLGKGLRGLGESVAHSLAGTRQQHSPSPPAARVDLTQPGVVTVIDIEGLDEEDGQDSEEPYEPMVAHFIAHSEAIIALKFDASGLMLVTADRRGHDFHVFRINPHPCGPGLASVHHLYILHRGDTTAKVQDIAISADSRWAAISTLRGTTHVFAVSPYGGSCGVRTHTHPRVVNRLSRFHRSAGLPIHPADKRSPASPVSEAVGAWFPNPRLPPYPAPTVSTPLAQLRPTPNLATHTVTRNSSGRQRLSSLSEDGSSVPLLARAAWGTSPGAPAHAQGAGAAARGAPRAALYLLAAGGTLAHLVLHPRPASNIPKEKICDESPIELSVEAVAQWPLARTPAATDLLAPLPPASPLLQPTSCRRCADMCISEEERWLSQVEIVTHAGPHRRLWMGPQFVFKTYSVTGSTSSLSEAETVEVEAGGGRVARSNPVNMPSATAAVPVLVDSGSASSLEHSPSDSFRRKSLLAESGRAASVCDVQLKEDLAEAMKEDHGLARSSSRAEAVGAGTLPGGGGRRAPALAVDPLGTVVAMGVEEAPPVTPDTPPQPNTDEDAFRCVVRAPAPLPPAAPATRALPAGTVIPAHGLPAEPLAPLAAAPRSLATAVRVPAARASIPAQPIDYAARDIRPPEDAIAPIPLRPRPCSLDRRAPDLDLPPPPPTSPPPLPAFDPRRRDSPQPPPPVAESPRKKSSRGGTPPKKEVFTEKSRRESPDVKLDRKPVETEKESPKTKRESTETKVPKEPAESKSSTKNPEGKSRKKADETKSISKRDSTEAKSASKRDGDAKSSSKKDSETKLPSKKDSETILPLKIDSEIKLSSRNEPTDSIDELVPTRTETKKEASPSKVISTSNRGWTDIKLSSRRESTEREVSSRKEEIESKTLTEEEISDIDRCLQESEIKIPSRRESADREPSRKSDSTKLKSSWMNDSESVWSLKSDTFDRREKSPKKEPSESRFTREQRQEDIKTEEQAWDMLLNEPDKPTLNVSLQTTIDKNDDKPKIKRNRKIKKSQDDPQNKSEDDSFVEIHAIEENTENQQSSGELVSISVPYEEIGSSSSYSSKTRKSRSPKSTIERKEEFETTVEEWSLEDVQAALKKSSKKKADATDNLEVPDLDSKLKSKEGKREKVTETKPESIEVATENLREPSVEKKFKPSAFEPRKSIDKAFESDIKDVYVIDSSKDEFPEIQITRANKTRKSKSPFVDKSAEEKGAERPAVKSWSSIAASKSPPKNDDKVVEKAVESEKEEVTLLDDTELPSTSVSLQEELIRLCKRTDIMVAKCDAPTELNFIDEHHSLLQDLPPLELDFGLDDSKLEVMRDCLLETDTKITSPICKINIDSILSSIKESTSAFNLIDLEKVPEKKKKGFSIIESDKITSQEVKADDDVKADSKEGVMEKSSDDDNTSPILSTDSDKEDKKPTGAPSVSMPSPKQSSKSKKSRRKKK